MDKYQLYTIGFTKKKAETFFNIIQSNGITKVIDVRLNNASQLAGFSKKDDLKYFLQALCGCQYIHLPLWAPTAEIFHGYRKTKQISWSALKIQFNALLDNRNAHRLISSPAELHKACLLCSEPTPERCHRRLVAEFLKQHFDDIEIWHL